MESTCRACGQTRTESAATLLSQLGSSKPILMRLSARFAAQGDTAAARCGLHSFMTSRMKVSSAEWREARMQAS